MVEWKKIRKGLKFNLEKSLWWEGDWEVTVSARLRLTAEYWTLTSLKMLEDDRWKRIGSEELLFVWTIGWKYANEKSKECQREDNCWSLKLESDHEKGAFWWWLVWWKTNMTWKRAVSVYVCDERSERSVLLFVCASVKLPDHWSSIRSMPAV